MRLRLLALGVAAAVPVQRPCAIPHVRSGHAELQQRGRLTVLELTSGEKHVQRIPLTHPSDYRQAYNPPVDAQVVAESPRHFLIFTDSFDSNPYNVQGKCGADDAGERYLHVVALGALPHETLSVLIESCLSGIEPSRNTPEWTPQRDASWFGKGLGGKLSLSFETGSDQSLIVYYVDPDGSVSRPNPGEDKSK